MRYFTAATAQARDHWGFAWAPSNTTGLPAADFATQTGQLLDRLAASIRDSAEAIDPETSGTGACGPPGQDSLCLVDIPGASHNEAWQSFRTWTQSTLTHRPRRRRPSLAGAASPAAHRLDRRERRDAGRGDAALELRRQGTFSHESARTVDEHADPDRLVRGARHLLLPRHARRQPHADGVGDRGHGRHADDLRRGRPGARSWRSLPRRRRSAPAPGRVSRRPRRTSSATRRPPPSRWRVTPAALGTSVRGRRPRPSTFTAGRLLGSGYGHGDGERHGRRRPHASRCTPPRSASRPSTFQAGNAHAASVLSRGRRRRGGPCRRRRSRSSSG